MKYNEALLIIRQNLISAFKRYEYLLIPIFRFVLSFSALRILKSVTSYNGILSGMIALAAIALVGAFASAECIEVCSILLVTIFMFGFNPIMAVILFLILCVVYILYGRLFPRESLLIIVTLVAFYIKMELAVPIITALFGSYVSIIAIILGTVAWFIIPEFSSLVPMAVLEKNQLIDTFSKLFTANYKELMANQTMMIMVIIFFTVFSVIYIIRKQAIDYGPYIAIGVGAIMSIIGFGMASIFFEDIGISLVSIVVESILFSLVASVMQFLSVVLDYQRAETVSFADDDNYYYVKIVPKIKLNFREKKVKKVYTSANSMNHYDRSILDDHDDFSNDL